MRRLLLIIVLGTALGIAVAAGLSGYLAISVAPKELPPWEGRPNVDSLPPLPLRMVDLGGVGIVADSADWGTSYRHATGRFDAVLRPDPPFVKPEAVPDVYAQFREYAERMRSLEFNAIEFGGFLRMVDFDSVGTGGEVYVPESVYRARHAAMRSFQAPLFRIADSLGMGVYIRTDMVTLSGPLEAYFDRNGLKVDDTSFWSVYRAALAELFTRFPEIRGMIIRIGEAGAVYNDPDSDYRSELWVRRTSDVQTMLRAFLEVAERYDRDIVFRSWTVGVGDVGDLHTNPETYERVLGPIDSPNLIVSTKVAQGDFWSHLSLNPTLFSGRHRRIVELQARREFEAFNVIPNYVGGLYQGALATYLERNPNIEGVWVWTQGGGPLRHGPMMVYPFVGNWIWTDANVFATATAALKPGGDARRWARDWATSIDCESQDASRLADALSISHRAAARGLTVPAFAEQKVRGMGLEVPPVIYSYWDIVDGSSAVGSHIYMAVRDELSGALEGIELTVADVRSVAARVNSVRGCGGWAPAMKASVAYEVALMETLAAHKRFLLEFNAWLDRGGDTGAWRNAATDFEEALALHRVRHSLDYPSYNFSMAERSARLAMRIPLLRWAAVVLLLMGAFLLYRPGAWLFWLWTTGSAAVLGALAAPWFTVVVSLGSGLMLAGIRWTGPLDTPWAQLVMRVRELPVLLVLVLIAVRGPQYIWFLFWTSDVGRAVLCIPVMIALVGHVVLLFERPLSRRMSGGLMALGAFLTILGGTAWAIGLETSLTALNEELMFLPGMLSRVLGIVTHLDIPAALGRWILVTGAVLVFAGGLVHSLFTRKTASSDLT